MAERPERWPSRAEPSRAEPSDPINTPTKMTIGVRGEHENTSPPSQARHVYGADDAPRYPSLGRP